MFGTSSGVGAWIACRTLTFSLRTSSAVKFTGGSIATWHSSCSMWFWIRSRSAPAGYYDSAGARADAEVLGGGDLDLIDVVAVPHGLEEPVGEPERHHVLHGLLAQVMVDAEDLVLVEHRQHLAVELLGFGQRRAERLLDHDAHVGALVMAQLARAQLADDDREEGRGGREVEAAVHPLPRDVVELVERLIQRLVDRSIVEGARDVA